MQVFVRGYDGVTVTLDVRPQEDVHSVKEQLLERRRMLIGRSGECDGRLIYGGYELKDENSLEFYGIRDAATLHETESLFGGGCDGGTTALQRKFMSQASTKKKEEIRDTSGEHRAKWEMCAASGAPLTAPVVCCELGYIYNKEAVLQQMATKTLHSNFSHIRRLKDLFTLHLHANADYSETKGSQTRLDLAGSTAKFICPITLKPANGKYPFAAIKGCGHVLSEQAVREVGSDGKCPVCGASFHRTKNVIPLNPNAEALNQRRLQLEAHRIEESRKRARADEEGTSSAVCKSSKISTGSSKLTASIHSSLTNSVTKSATLGTAAHVSKAKTDPVYASMFKPKGVKEYDAAWGQGAMAGVLGSR